MKRLIIYIACGLLGTVAGMGLYGWRQATYLPTEYQLSGAVLQSEAFSAERLLSQQITAGAGQDNITLDEADLSQLLAQGLAAQPESETLIEAVRGIDASIQADRIEAGLVMNLSELPRETLPVEVQQAIAQLEQALPVLMERDVYIGIAGRPQVEAGRLIFDRKASIQVGRLQLPLVDLANQMGISPGQLEESLTNYLHRNGIYLEAIDLEDGRVVITPQPQS